jgi:hypothetical protein
MEAYFDFEPRKDLEKPIDIVIEFVVKETNQPELHSRRRRESEPGFKIRPKKSVAERSG